MNNNQRYAAVHPASSCVERTYSVDEWDFMTAIDKYKRDTGRRFPTWCEILAIAEALGWRRVAESQPIPGSEKW